MRVVERIDYILGYMKTVDSKVHYLKHLYQVSLSSNANGLFGKDDLINKIGELATDWHNNQDKVEKFWKKNPDLRLVQVLEGLSIIPHVSSPYVYKMEDENYLIDYKIAEPRNILFWKSKSGNILLSQLDIDHIKNILKDYLNPEHPQVIGSRYFELLVKELFIRGVI